MVDVEAAVASENLKKKMEEIEDRRELLPSPSAEYDAKLRDDQFRKESAASDKDQQMNERRVASNQAAAEKAAAAKEHEENRDRHDSRKAMFDLEREQIRKDKATAEKEANRADAARSKIEQDAADAKERQRAESIKDQDRIEREEAARQRDAEKQQQAYQRNLNRSKQPSQRAAIRQAMEGQQRKEEARRQTFQQQQGARMRGMTTPPRSPITTSGIMSAIGSGVARAGIATDRVVTGALGGFANSLVMGRPQKQSNRLYRQETKALSGAVRNRELGRNPFKSVIGASGTSTISYQTDGHGRSGRRATLEWRRENRQYTSETRANAAAINHNWVSEVAGIAPEPVRQRQVHTRHGRRMSPLEAFVNRL